MVWFGVSAAGFSLAKANLADDWIRFWGMYGYESGEPSPASLVRFGTGTNAASVDFYVTWQGDLATNHFFNPTGSVHFAPGEVQKKLGLLPIRDGLVKGTQVFTVWLTNVVGSTILHSHELFFLHDEQVPAGRDHSFPKIHTYRNAKPLVLPDDSFLLAGPLVLDSYTEAIYRFGADGSRDPGFMAPVSAAALTAAHPLADGSMLVAGDFRSLNGNYQATANLLHLSPTGEILLDFSEWKHAAFIGFQSDGKPILHARLPQIPIEDQIVRLTAHGALDETFTPFNSYFPPGTVLADDSILVMQAGMDPLLLKLRPDGALAEDWPEMAYRYGTIRGIVPFRGGDFAVITYGGITRYTASGEQVYTVSGSSAHVLGDELYIFESITWGHTRLRRLDRDGGIDPSFLEARAFLQLASQSDGNLLVLNPVLSQGGYFFHVLERLVPRNIPMQDFFFDRETYSIHENTGGEILVRRTGDTSGQAVVRVAALSAERPFHLDPEELVFEPLEAGKSFQFSVAPNGLPEADKDVVLSLEIPPDTVPGPRVTTVRVVDADGRPGSQSDFSSALWRVNEPPFLVSDMKSAPDGRVLITGVFGTNGLLTSHLAVAFHETGRSDDTFQAESKHNEISLPSKLAIQSDGKILVIGSFVQISNGVWENSEILRLTPEGRVDTSFKGLPDLAYGWEQIACVAVQSDDKILVGGTFGMNRTNNVLRMHPDGELDDSFAVSPFPQALVHDLLMQKDGKILIRLEQSTSLDRALLARLNSDGTLDETFTVWRSEIPVWFSVVALDQDRRILGASWDETKLFRLTENGSPDPSFQLSGAPNGVIRAILPLSDGKILVGGNFTRIGGVKRPGLARLNPDGSVDAWFDPGSGFQRSFIEPRVLPAVGSLLLLQNGDVLVGGGFDFFNGFPVPKLVRIKTELEVRFVAPELKNGTFSGHITGTPGERLRFDRSSDLQTWAPVATNSMPGYSAPFTIPAYGERVFYRAVRE